MKSSVSRAIVGIVLLARFATAQQVDVAPWVFTVKSDMRFGWDVVAQSGTWVGFDAGANFGKLRFGLTSAMGTLTGGAEDLRPETHARLSALSAEARVKPWLGLGLTAEAKRFQSDAGINVWRLIGGNIHLVPVTNPDGFEPFADVTYWPAASFIGGQSMSLAMRAVLGAVYMPAGRPIGIRVAYRFERFDFEGDGDAMRLEQFRGAMIGAQLRLRR